MSYDVVIIGGGLAGLTLSIQLAKGGVKVALLEREKYPFHKVCGEYIAMESWGFLTDCGVPLAEMALPRIKKLRISAPNGKTINHLLDPGGFGISRFTLDQYLANLALQNGVYLVEECKVENVVFEDDIFQIQSATGDISAKLVVGSFGKRSNLDVKLKRKFIQHPQPPKRNYVGVKYHIHLDFPEDLIELHNFEDGYCGISKVDGDKYCLCYLTSAQNLQKYGSIKQMEERALMKNPFLNTYFSTSNFLYDAPLSISQINFADKSIVDNHVVMVGDSAGLITPLCGNGMSMAMHGSKILSSLIPDFISGRIKREEMERKYAIAWRQQFNTRITAGRLIQYSFGKEILTNAMIGLLKPFPSVVKGLVSLTHGKDF